MECQGEFVFKTFMFRPAGSFKDEDGSDISYSSAYKLKVDQQQDDGSIKERVFTVKENETILINTLKQFKAYDKIILYFDVVLYNTNTVITLKDATLFDDFED